MTECTGAGKRLRMLPFYPALEEPQGFGSGNAYKHTHINLQCSTKSPTCHRTRQRSHLCPSTYMLQRNHHLPQGRPFFASSSWIFLNVTCATCITSFTLHNTNRLRCNEDTRPMWYGLHTLRLKRKLVCC